jgi:hypothetical protein
MALVAACSADSSTIPMRDLGPAEASYPEPFGFLRAVRPLPDGRVLVADPLGDALLALDMTAGTADTIGRIGAGPREHKQPDAVFPLPGDSTLLIDLGNGRLTTLDPDLEPVSSRPMAVGRPDPEVPGGGMVFITANAVDGRGRVYFRGRGITVVGPSMIAFADSAPIMRFDRTTDLVDTVAMVRLRRREVVLSGTGRNRNADAEEFPLSPEDAWDVSGDDRVAVARTDGYYVEWIDDAGRTAGPDVAYDPVSIRRADQEDFVANMYVGGMSMTVSLTNGVRTTGFFRGGNTSPDDPKVEDYQWPAVMPPFAAYGVHVTPEGDAWVRRARHVGDPTVYDVFDANGALREQVLLPAGRRVIGFADGSVYAVRKDDVDLFWLERFRR